MPDVVSVSERTLSVCPPAARQVEEVGTALIDAT